MIAACPFCSSTDCEVVFFAMSAVVCRKCGATGPCGPRLTMEPDNRSQARGEALRLWETRGGEVVHPATGRKERKVPAASKWGFEMALWLRELMPENMRLAATWLDRWAEVFDAMAKLDKRKDDEIVKVCEWARQDSFWSRNFLSPVKLRERNKDGIQYFDVFVSAMQAGKKAEAPALRLR